MLRRCWTVGAALDIFDRCSTTLRPIESVLYRVQCAPDSLHVGHPAIEVPRILDREDEHVVALR
eukprot:1831674-Pleurochrysis_carterae.AAC.1